MSETPQRERRYFKYFHLLAGLVIGFLGGLYFAFSYPFPALLELNSRHHAREIRNTQIQKLECPQYLLPPIMTINEWERHCDKIFRTEPGE